MTRPPQRGAWRGAALLAQRACFAALVFESFWSRPLRAGQSDPVGVARYMDFSFLADPALLPALQVGLVVALLLYVVGIAMPLATGALCFVWTGAGALYCSRGAVGHATQLVALVLLAQSVAYALSAAARWAGSPSTRNDRHERAVWYTKQTIVATYVVAGVTKLLRTSGSWIIQAPNLSVQIIKTHDQTYYSTLAGGLLERGELIASTILAYPNAMRLLLCGSLVLELGAVVALVQRRFSIAIGLALVAMHRGISQLMLLRFREHEVLLLIYLVEVPVFAVAAARWLWTAPQSPIALRRAARGAQSQPRRP